jgi:hypothetical protein
MTIEATLDEVRALIELAVLDDPGDTPPRKGDAARREVIRKGLKGGQLIARHQTLLEAGRCPTIVPIERETCSACHLQLPTMLVSRARHSPAILTCTHCQRMLFWPALLGMEAETARDPEPARKASPPRRKSRVAIGRF